jgi:predicted permease
VAIVLVVIGTVAVVIGLGWVMSRILNFEVKQLRQMNGFSRFVQYEDEDHPREK